MKNNYNLTPVESLFLEELEELEANKPTAHSMNTLLYHKKVYNFIDRVVNTYTNPVMGQSMSTHGMALLITTATFLID